MKLVVASHNPVKINAVAEAFAKTFPDQEFELEPISVPSGVADQPTSDAETLQGAKNRALNAADATEDADFTVGLEGGIDTIGGQLFTFAWMAVRTKDGKIATARTSTLPLPPRVAELLDEGFELGHAMDKVFNAHNTKQKGGAIGLLTEGLYDRTNTYVQALCFALVAIKNELF